MKSLIVVILFIGVCKGWLIFDTDLKSTQKLSRYDETWPRSSGEPLILTPYLNNGKIDQARAASQVPPLVGNIQSYAGFFTVNQDFDSNMYWWYFPAEESPETAPVVLWMQGGPGGSSLYGLFDENGPYAVGKDGSLELREIYWSKTMHVIYIDNPVGTGFSFTRDDAGYSTDEATIGNNLYIALQQFYTMFPELRSNDFFIAGESYAGKYIPALGYTIHMNNPSNENKINLKGLAIGNGLTDPINQIDYGSFLFGIGLIDLTQKAKYEELQDFAKQAIQSNDPVEGFLAYTKIVGGPTSLFYNTTGYEYVYNYLISNNIGFDSGYVPYLEKPSVRDAIHVGKQSYQMISKDVYVKLVPDFTKSVAPWVSILADNYRMMMYNGELDIAVAYPLTAAYLNKLDWCGAEEFASAERYQYRVEDQLAGYIKTSNPDHCNGSIRLVMVRKAGHTVPQDQPLWAYNLISDFTQNRI